MFIKIKKLDKEGLFVALLQSKNKLIKLDFKGNEHLVRSELKEILNYFVGKGYKFRVKNISTEEIRMLKAMIQDKKEEMK